MSEAFNNTRLMVERLLSEAFGMLQSCCQLENTTCTCTMKSNVDVLYQLVGKGSSPTHVRRFVSSEGAFFPLTESN